MANPEHLEILKQGLGVEIWNEWRRNHPKIIPDLTGANLGGANLRDANLGGANLSGVNLTAAKLSRAHLSSADLSDAKLINAYLTGVKLNRADISGADLRGADLTGANLHDANLRGVSLRDANLSRVDLSGADLTGVNLRNARLNGAGLSDANLSHAALKRTVFADIDLRKVKGLEDVKHYGPSEVSISTIYRSEGQIPEIFLRGCGVPDDFITYMRSLAGKAIEFYSCFISYSSRDQEFADRLYADLQNKGVRCWFAPEDLKIGDRFRDRIDESIRLHDKLLLILSENSVSSQWVGDEVEAAFERERREQRIVLFPIRIDGAMTDSDRAWAATIRRMRHVGDFTCWKEQGPYRKAFDRLLRDLQAGA